MKQSNTAKAQISVLRRHFDDKNRLEASRNLTAAIRQAVRQIDAGKGWPAPRPYPELARPGRAWTHAGRYWFLYKHHSTARSPRRFL